VIADRVLQARVVNALEPEWEARFEPKSYGFRPGRGCQDAISAIYLTLKGKNPQRTWVLDADLKAAFDRIDHDHLLSQLGTFPARGMVESWLKAGVLERGQFAPTEEGTPQGGVVSPLLLNVALHGLERAAGVRYRKLGTHAAEFCSGPFEGGHPPLIRARIQDHVPWGGGHGRGRMRPELRPRARRPSRTLHPRAQPVLSDNPRFGDDWLVLQVAAAYCGSASDVALLQPVRTGRV